MSERAVFLDRDGVLIADVHLLVGDEQIRLLPGTAQAVGDLKNAGFKVVVVSNQTVISRGLASESQVDVVNACIDQQIRAVVSLGFDGIYYCPHHPHATLPKYRVTCECRKPRAGMLLQAARELDIDLTASYMVGDRISDIIAGRRAGCRVAQVRSWASDERSIVFSEPVDVPIEPDFVGPDLPTVAAWILEQGQ